MDTAPHEESTNPPPPPPQGSSHASPRRLYRYPEHGPLGGVSAGIGAYFSVDPTIVRLAAVAVALAGPGVILYILAWIFVPKAPDASLPSPAPGARAERGTQVLGIILVIVAVSVFWGHWWLPGEGFVLPVALIAVGAWLLVRRDPDDDQPHAVAAAAPATPGPELGGATSPSVTSPAGAVDDDTQRWQAVPDPNSGEHGPGDGVPPTSSGEGGIPDPAVRRRRRLLGPVVTGVLLLWAGVASLAGIDLEDGLAVALCIVGVGFVLGAFVGGGKVLVVPAALIAAALVVTAVIDVPLSGGIGDRTWRPASITAVEASYHLGIGEGTLDLTAVEPDRGDTLEIEASIGVGHLIVEVPDDVSLILEGSASAGEIVFLGHSVDGVGVDQDHRDGGDARHGTLSLDLAVGLGQIEVVRA